MLPPSEGFEGFEEFEGFEGFEGFEEFEGLLPLVASEGSEGLFDPPLSVGSVGSVCPSPEPLPDPLSSVESEESV